MNKLNLQDSIVSQKKSSGQFLSIIFPLPFCVHTRRYVFCKYHCLKICCLYFQFPPQLLFTPKSLIVYDKFIRTMRLSYKTFKRSVNKDSQAYFEQIVCNSCTPLSILTCILQTRVDFAVKHRGTPWK